MLPVKKKFVKKILFAGSVVRKFRWGCFFYILLTFVACANFGAGSLAPISKSTTDFLDTVITVSFYQKQENGVISSIFQEISKVHDSMNTKNPESEISRASYSATTAPFTLSEDTYYVVKKAYEISVASQGAFDLTINPLVNLWNFNSPTATVPSDSDIQYYKGLVNYQDVVLDHEKRQIFLARDNMSIDLGAVAKGYAGDLSAKVAREMGVKSALLDLGGNIVAVGAKPNGSPFKIGVKAPFDSGYFGVLHISDLSCVTSGGYERNFVQDGVTYHHILDPKTGYPADKGLASVTIVAESSLLCDMLSTAVFVLGLDKGKELVEEYGARGVFVLNDKRFFVSQGLEFELTNNDYLREWFPSK